MVYLPNALLVGNLPPNVTKRKVHCVFHNRVAPVTQRGVKKPRAVSSSLPDLSLSAITNNISRNHYARPPQEKADSDDSKSSVDGRIMTHDIKTQLTASLSKLIVF